MRRPTGASTSSISPECVCLPWTSTVTGGRPLGRRPSACEAEVTVRWPDAASTTEIFELGGGYRYRIEQSGEAQIERPMEP